MSELPDAMDAKHPGVFDFGGLRLFNLGDNLWIVAGRDRNTVDHACAQLKKHIPESIVLGVGTNYDVAYTPLEESLDLRRMIRLVVREELSQSKSGVNNG